MNCNPYKLIFEEMMTQLRFIDHSQNEIKTQWKFLHYNQDAKWSANLYTHIQIEIFPQLGFEDQKQVANWDVSL